MIGFRQDGRRAARLLCGASAAALLSLPSAAAGGDRYWDPNGTAIGRGGAGEWNLTSPLWSPGSDGVSGPYATWNNSAFDDAIFGGAAGGAVTLLSQINARSLTFEAPGYVLTGGTLMLGGDKPTISTVGSNTGVTIDSVIDGNQGLTKALAGVLRLNGANLFSGDVFLEGGTLVIDGDAALGVAANRVFTSGGSTLTASGSLSVGRVIDLGAGLTTLSGAGVGSARLTGSGGVAAVQGVALNNDLNDFTGQATFFVNGSAYFTSVRNLGEASSLGAANSAAEGTIRFTAANQYADWLRYVGVGDISNRNWEFAYSGATSAAGLSNDGTGILTLTGDIVSIGGSGAGMLFVAQTADLELLGVLSSGGNRTFTYRGGDSTRTITLGGANTYAGATHIGPGGGLTVRATVLADTGQASSFGTGGAGGVTLSNNSVLQYVGAGASSNRDWAIGAEGPGNGSGGGILNDGSGALSLSGAVDFAATANNSLTLGGGFGGVNTLSGVISGAGTLVGSGEGVWVLSGDNTRTGAIVVDGGVLRAGHASAFGTTTGVTINAGTLDLNGYDLSTATLSGSGGEIALGGAVLTVDGATGASFAGSISGSGGLVKRGMSTLTLTGANIYSGDTTINGGAINLDFSRAGSPTTDILSGATTLTLAGGTLNAVGGAGVANSQSFNSVSVLAGSNRIKAVSGVDGDMTLDLGAINRTGGLIDFTLTDRGVITTSNTSLGGWATVNGSDYAKVVGGVITAFGASDYTTKDDAGAWLDGDYVTDDDGNADSFHGTVSSSIQLGGLRYTVDAPSRVMIDAGEALGVDGTIIVADSVGANNQEIRGGSLTGSFGGGVLGLQQNGGGTFTIASAITDNNGAIGFTKAGTGTVRLNGVNTYTGATTLSGGRLEITSVAKGGEASSLGASSADSFNLILESGVLAFDGADGTTDRGFTLVNGGASAPTIEVAGGKTLEFAGQVTSSDDAGLTKTGGGTLVLSNAANDYVGVTTVTGGGVLSVNTLADGGVASGLGAASSDSANLILAGGGRLQYTGVTVAIDRGFTLDTGNGRVDVAQAGTTLTISGTAVGAGGLIKDGDGVLVLSGINTYKGNTTVNGGTLRAGSQQSFSLFSFMTLNNGSRLELGGYDITVAGLLGDGIVDLGEKTLTSSGGSANSFEGRITGAGNFIRSGSWTQNMARCVNDYTGTTTISGGGRLSINCLADGGAASSIGA